MERRHELAANAHRFGGFADLYDRVRPTPPATLATVIAAYAGGRPRFVVDLGSGTGLSTRWTATWADEVVGIEPSHDMRTRATHVTVDPHVRYLSGWSDETGLPDGCADVVLAVQALHWMEPVVTFTEVARLLRPGGVFVAIDCDWPPLVGDPSVEAAWSRARSTIAVYEHRLARGVSGPELGAPVHDDEGDRDTGPATVAPRQTDDLRPVPAGDAPGTITIAEGVRYWHKGDHLRRLATSGRFAHCVELCATAVEPGDAARLVDLLRSQGDYQTLRRHGVSDVALGVDAFAAEVHARLAGPARPFFFTYRARLAVR